ncbi:hypothetical protein BUALT_Bualt07G0079400 [Buddleja alternifolia]|uniref:Tetraspanin n=1 Tax=Buddleja alternifolia TaxID=168488 RepID=A0AAV6XH54_9LAMI|nr:hypothetical protein BUALT_Bualt07G0079400 [Buddleja alternifolia]
MARISNGIITGLNVLTLILAFSALGFSLWFNLNKSGTPCQTVLKTPLLIIGAALAVVSLVGLVGACYRVSFLMWIYLFVLFLLIIGLMAFTVFTIIVTNRGIGRALSGKGAGHFRLGDYSTWLHRYVANAKNWHQSGCCKPPNYCGFKFQSATNWTMPKTGPAVPDPDCKTWSNDQKQLCFECESCKMASLDTIKREWRLLALINVGIIILVIIVYTIGCYALRNNRYSYRKGMGYA